MPHCEFKLESFCNGEDLRMVQLKTAVNVYDGAIIMMCRGCRDASQGGYKYARAPLISSVPLPKPKAQASRNYSTNDIVNWKFPVVDLPQQWRDHLGEVPRNFRMLIKGKPKNGKTEYCFQQSKMFAELGLKVSYNSPEQGKSQSFQAAAIRNKLDEIKGKWMLCGKSCKQFEPWLKYLERPNSGQVILLDSIDRMKLTEQQYVQLDQRFPNKALVMVCWDNPMSAAAKAIEYYVDIIVDVKHFTAESFSRYGGNKPYVIWDRKRKAQLELGINQN